ncbi:MAG: diguanylate cyclase/phosphodiesterase [Bacillales bacterium]|jgi:diguanylate cyclase (GGDEF)-like protein|nr:diguanylate cyclase/phosphodiesterase [Bacillales bacterium]
MFKTKPFTPKINRETFLFIFLLGCTLISSAFQVTFVYGITIAYTSIFLFLIFRIYGLQLAIFATLLTFLFVPTTYNYIVSSIILLIEIIFVGTYFHIRKKAKMFFVDASFWLTVGLVALFLLNRLNLVGDALYFQICKEILNGLFNVLIADMLLAYLPFYRLLNSIPLNKNNASIHQILSHITILSVMIPFFLIILSKTWTVHEFTSNNLKREAENSVQQIKKELIQHTFLSGNSQQKNELDKVVYEYTTTEFDIIITNSHNEIISSSSSFKHNSEKYFHLNDMYEIKKISTNYFEALPKGQKGVPPILKWRSGKLILVDQVDSLSIKIYIQYPISQYQDQIFKEFLIYFKLSILFLLLAILFIFIVNRLLMNNLKQLIVATTDLPQKVFNLKIIDWPQANISEFRLLTQNLQGMAQKLKELFHESIDMNRILTSQTKMLRDSEEKLQQLAYYDVLTSLPNRLYFQNYVKDLINNNPQNYIAIIFMDLIQFKQVNDTLGHDAGDKLLQLISDRLRNLHVDGRMIFRLGGDEFVIVQEVTCREEILNTVEIIRSEFSSPFIINGQVLYSTSSMGISVYPHDGQDLDTLVKCADIAMYVSKESVGNEYQFFNEKMRDRFQERLLIENSLRKVVEQVGLKLFYQPKMQLGVVSSFEALLRWEDPILGNISPSTFIPLAEEIGLISAIDKWVLMEACKQNKKWQDEQLPKVPISVNISAKEFQNDELIKWIENALDESGMSPEYLKLEITESIFIKDPERVVKLIIKIKGLGVQISIDDFGKGYSSFIHLLQLPIDELKIDREFIKDIDQNDKQQIFVKTIIDLAHGLHLHVVAEGVETHSEMQFLLNAGCDELQGYVFSPPISNIDMTKYLIGNNNKNRSLLY